MYQSKSKEILNTLQYYDKNSSAYFDRTIQIDMAPAREIFVNYLTPKAKILDAGCGVGRDTKGFLDAGYDVKAIDASKEMVRISSDYTGKKSEQLFFEDMTFDSEFDGIWCSASLLHFSSDQLKIVIEKFYKALKPGGIWFLSFIKGDFEGYVQERYYNYLNEKKLQNLLIESGNIDVLEIQATTSYEKGNTAEWIHCFAKRGPCCFCQSEFDKTFNEVVFDSEHFYVVRDNFPVTKHHLLIISKVHVKTWFDADKSVQIDLIDVLNKCQKWLQDTYNSIGYNVGFNCGIASGQTIPHLHVHVIPRYPGDCHNPEGGVRGVIPSKQKYKNI